MFKFMPIYFLIFLCIGFLIVYSLSPKSKVVVKSPTLENVGKILYRDDNDICYKYEKIIVPCNH